MSHYISQNNLCVSGYRSPVSQSTTYEEAVHLTFSPIHSPVPGVSEGLLESPVSPSDDPVIETTDLSKMTYLKKGVINRLGRGWPILEVVDVPLTVPGM